MFTKYKHHNEDLEAAVVGICLFESDAYMTAKTMLEPDHFYHEGYKATWELMENLWNEGVSVDLLTTTHFANKRGLTGKLDGNPGYFLTNAMTCVKTSAHIVSHCLILRELFMSREMYRLRMEAPKDDLDPLESIAITKAAIDKALQLNVDDDWIDMSQGLLKLQKHMQDVKVKNPGVLTGFTEFDKLTFGLQPTNLIIIGARPSIGKSAFATTLAINAAKMGSKIGIISLEMPSEQLVGRITSIYSDIEFWRIYRSKFNNDVEEQTAYSRMSDMSGLPIFFSDKTNVTAGHIRAKAQKLKNTKGLDLLIIDYLQLIETDGKKNENREREIAKLSRALKLLAMDLKIPIMVLAQLNRASETSGDKTPKLSQLRESGALEQDADMGIILSRDGNEAILDIQKHRNGDTMPLKLQFDGYRMMFLDPPGLQPVYDNPRAGIGQTPF
jgi:replicative DNA helicase